MDALTRGVNPERVGQGLERNSPRPVFHESPNDVDEAFCSPTALFLMRQRAESAHRRDGSQVDIRTAPATYTFFQGSEVTTRHANYLVGLSDQRCRWRHASAGRQRPYPRTRTRAPPPHPRTQPEGAPHEPHYTTIKLLQKENLGLSWRICWAPRWRCLPVWTTLPCLGMNSKCLPDKAQRLCELAQAGQRCADCTAEMPDMKTWTRPCLSRPLIYRFFYE